jgi:branched-chain amino acid transport system permease protein
MTAPDEAAIMDILNAIVGLLLEIINTVLQPILEQLAVIGFRESVVQFMLINAVLGLSIYLTLNTGLLSLANAGFMAIGAYVSVVLTMEGDLSFGLALICGALAAGLVAIPIGLPVLRLRNIYLAIATIGFGEIVRIVILNFDGLATSLLGPDEPYDFTHGARGINRIPKLTETAHLVLILLLLAFFMYRLHRSRMGRAMAAVRQDEKVAATLGIDVVYYKNLAFILGAIVAGTAGGLSGHATRVITPGDFGFGRAVDILAFAVLGGLSHWSGPVLGGMALKAIPERLRYLAEYTGALTGAILLLIIVYLPGGLISLLRPSYWREGGRFDLAKRLASVGMALVALVNILPYRDLGRSGGQVLGYELWGLIGLAAILAALYWISSRQPQPQGGYFALPLSVLAGALVVVLLVIGLFGLITDLSDGYYANLIGLVLVGIAGLITYPPEAVGTPDRPGSGAGEPLSRGV